MKYENPTCEIVVLNHSDCLTASAEPTWRTEDAPYLKY